MKKKNTFLHEPLGVSLSDIENIEKRGKWWLVGASWKGQETRNLGSTADTQDSELIMLARAQKMNTEARKMIFVTVMSSEDYLDCLKEIYREIHTKQKHGTPTKNNPEKTTYKTDWHEVWELLLRILQENEIDPPSE